MRYALGYAPVTYAANGPHFLGVSWPAQWYTDPALGYALQISAMLYDTMVMRTHETSQPQTHMDGPPTPSVTP